MFHLGADIFQFQFLNKCFYNNNLGAGGVASLLERSEGQDRWVWGAVGQAQSRLCGEEKVSSPSPS